MENTVRMVIEIYEGAGVVATTKRGEFGVQATSGSALSPLLFVVVFDEPTADMRIKNRR